MNQEINIKHDGVFDIAIGRSRRETHWRNKEMSWSDFLKRIRKTHYAAERYSEYMAELRDLVFPDLLAIEFKDEAYYKHNK